MGKVKDSALHMTENTLILLYSINVCFINSFPICRFYHEIEEVSHGFEIADAISLKVMIIVGF